MVEALVVAAYAVFALTGTAGVAVVASQDFVTLTRPTVATMQQQQAPWAVGLGNGR